MPLPSAQYDIVGIGRAFTDFIADVDDSFLRRNGLIKGRGVDASPARILAIRSELEGYTQPGGSPSNTVAGIAALGGTAAFIGKVCDDAGGRAFRNAFRQGNILFPNADHPAGANAISATCLVLSTPDESVTMVSNPGVADRLTRAEIDPELIGGSRLLHIQGHLLASPECGDTMQYAIDIAHRANRRVSISLNDLYLPQGQNGFLSRADFLIGNRREFAHNYPGRDIADFRDSAAINVITDGGNGAYVAGHGNIVHAPAISLVPSAEAAIPSYVGAGDQFAAGFLFGFLNGLNYAQCGRLGAETAAAVMRSASARPKGDWRGIGANYVKSSARGPL